MRILVPTLLLTAALAAAAWAEDDPAQPAIRSGVAAPAWRLNDHEGRARTAPAPDEGVWTVLAFFPRASTPG